MGEEKSFFLREAVSGSCRIPDIPSIAKGTDFTGIKHGLPTAKNKVNRAFNVTARKVLTEQSGLPKLIGKKSIIAFDQIRRKRAEEERILCGGEGAVMHLKRVSADTECYFLSLFLGREGIIHNRKMLHYNTVGTDGKRPGTECVIVSAETVFF